MKIPSSDICFLGNFNVAYSTETHHVKTLRSMGYEVKFLQEGQTTAEQVLEYAMQSKLFVWVHTHGWDTPGDMTKVLHALKKANIKTMTYHLDLWMGLQREKDLDTDPIYKNIQHFFTVDKIMADWFNDNTNVSGHYLPAGVFYDECYIAPQPIRKDIVFVGSKTYHQEWPYRPELVNWLVRSYGQRFQHWGKDGRGVVRGHALNKLYASTKIAIGDTLCPNFTYPYYWSDRIYETIGRGGFLIHPYIKGLDDEFEDKKHLIFYEYQNFKELKSLINYYLSKDKEREAIRREGHSLVKENYTYRNRWQKIFQELS